MLPIRKSKRIMHRSDKDIFLLILVFGGAIASLVSLLVQQPMPSANALGSSDSIGIGLWPTGVDEDRKKITATSISSLSNPAYSIDKHWVISYVMRPNGSTQVEESPGDIKNKAGSGTCQYSSLGGGAGKGTGMDVETPAYIVYENGTGGAGNSWGGMWEGTMKVGGGTADSASWIGQNIFGLNYSSADCYDPTVTGLATYDYANVYAFKLKNDFTIPSYIDASKYMLKLDIGGIIDNRVQAYVNSCQLLVTGHDNKTGKDLVNSTAWFYSGHNKSNYDFTFTNPADRTDCFKNGANSLTFLIQSTAPLTGLKITKIRLQGYGLTPNTKVNGESSVLVSSDSTVNFTHTVNDVGMNSDNTDYQAYELYIPSGTPTPTGYLDEHLGPTSDGKGYDCSYYKTVSSVGCKTISPKGSSKFVSGETKSVGDEKVNISGLGYPIKPGDRVCRILGVASRDISGEKNRDYLSSAACVIIAKQPNVQIRGGDLSLGDALLPALPSNLASASTGTKQINDRTYGSWVEYGIFAPSQGSIKSVSAGALSGKLGYAGALSDSVRNVLSFSNTSSPAGQWSSALQLRSIRSQLGQAALNMSVSSNAVNLNDLSSNGSILADRVSVINLSSATTKLQGTFSKNAVVVIISDGTIEIDGNIYLGLTSYSRIEYASQIIIVAHNIVIAPSVSNIDAWLVAEPSSNGEYGRISTCGPIQTGMYYSGLKAGDECSRNTLLINGPVITGELQLRRTNGAGSDTMNIPAEIINLRPDAYMWIGMLNSGDAKDLPIRTIFTHELPPRF